MRSLLHHTIFVSAVLGASAAEAQPAATPSPAGVDAREQERSALFQEGRELAASGRWADAVDRFRRVVELRSAPKALFTLGEAEQHLGRLARAQHVYESALADARGEGDHEVEAAAEQALRSLGARVPTVSVLLDDKTAAVWAAAVDARVDGEPLRVGVPTAVDPGPHAIRVEAKGARSFEQRIDVAEGDRRYVVVALQALPGKSPTALPVSPPPARGAAGSHTWIPLAVGGLGLAAAAVGAVVWVSGAHDYDSASDQCPAGQCPTAQLRDDGNRARGDILLGESLVGAGGLVLVGAAIGWWRLSTAGPGVASANLSVNRDGARLTVGGSF